jgi:hypothetical protein
VGVEGTAVWLEAIGTAAGVSPTLIGAAKQRVLPAIACALGATVRAAIGGASRFTRMQEFFGGVGVGHAAGYGFADTPVDRPEVKERFRRHMIGQAKKRKAEEMI